MAVICSVPRFDLSYAASALGAEGTGLGRLRVLPSEFPAFWSRALAKSFAEELRGTLGIGGGWGRDGTYLAVKGMLGD